MKTRRVFKTTFLRKTHPCSQKIQLEIHNFLAAFEDMIDHFEYGHEPGHRVFKVVLKSGDIKMWNLVRTR